jgi:hypothetical protein
MTKKFPIRRRTGGSLLKRAGWMPRDHTGEEVMIRITGCMLTLTLVLTLASSCVPPPPGSDRNRDPNALIKLRAEKNSAEDHVLRAKQFSDASKQQQARKLYDDAIEHYNAYVDGLLSCIRSGERADLTPSANEASAAAGAFRKFVDENSTTKGGVDPVTIVTKLVDVANSLIKQTEEKHDKERKQFADDLAPQIRWRKWIEIN